MSKERNLLSQNQEGNEFPLAKVFEILNQLQLGAAEGEDRHKLQDELATSLKDAAKHQESLAKENARLQSELEAKESLFQDTVEETPFDSDATFRLKELCYRLWRQNTRCELQFWTLRQVTEKVSVSRTIAYKFAGIMPSCENW